MVHALDTAPSTSADAVQASVAAALGLDPAARVVLVGSDTGALQALNAAAEADPAAPLQGLIVAGVASTDGASTADPGDWQAELEARTACPTHRQKLTDDAGFSRGRLSEPVLVRAQEVDGEAVRLGGGRRGPEAGAACACPSRTASDSRPASGRLRSVTAPRAAGTGC
ncbi:MULTISPECIES: hypothetical protein [Streptomyces]|uniref:hypothetical protein n=1 Tax=Streptomyces TaxID=1883 RepID=UPI002DD7AD5C|nr:MULTISPECIES: hypothetical protein [unclassified Streptomyces]WSD93702.1 hypothetical protein OG758_05595 [Streptomyces sp. NBC_01474]